MSDSDIKVTDKRMFTPDGRLREDFKHLESAAAPDTAASSEPVAERDSEPPGSEARAETETSQPGGGAPAGERPPLELPGTPEGLGAPTFYDLVGVLAEPVLVYLGDATLPDGTSGENLEAARIYIDLLDVLRQKTAGRLSSQEATFLEDLLYQLRMRHVQKRG